jgi:adenylate cyclase
MTDAKNTDAEDKEPLKQTLYRYMTQELAEQLLENPDAARVGGEAKEVSILFANIHDYQALAEGMTVEAVVEMLNTYFEVMVDVIFEHQGTLDKYIGSAMMAIFGSPLPLEDHAWKAVQAAVAMRDRLIDLNAKFAESQQPIIEIGIGINTATVAVGMIGSLKRIEYTAIGNGVNLSSLFQSKTREFGCDIIIGETTYQHCANRVQVRDVGSKLFNGRREAVQLYELVGLL